MTTISEAIKNRNYNLLGNLDDEEDVLADFFNYSGSTYICDAISEIADSNTPVYNYDIWEGASSISEYIEEAIEEGIAPTDGRNVDLIRILMCGYYVYYERSLYDNLDTLAFNYVVDKVNEAISNLSENTANSLNITKIEDDVEKNTESFDNNSKFYDLDEIAENIINNIYNGIYGESEQ